jgi:molybdate transport system permease protein
MPFVVQPLQQAFEAIPERTLEAAATLRAGPLDRFFTVALPLARPGLSPPACWALRTPWANSAWC